MPSRRDCSHATRPKRAAKIPASPFTAVMVAVPVILKRIGEFTLWAGVRGVATSVLLTGVLVVYLAAEALSSRIPASR